MLKPVARLCYQRRKAVLVGWIALLVGLSVSSGVAGGASRTEFSLPGSESQAALDLLEERGVASHVGEQAQVVFTAPQGVDDPAVRRAMEGLFADIEREVAGADVVSPYDEAGARQVSADRTIA